MQANHEQLTTETLKVTGVEVVARECAGKEFNGPWDMEEIGRLRTALREMPRRSNYVVVVTDGALFIHHKQESVK